MEKRTGEEMRRDHESPRLLRSFRRTVQVCKNRLNFRFYRSGWDFILESGCPMLFSWPLNMQWDG